MEVGKAATLTERGREWIGAWTLTQWLPWLYRWTVTVDGPLAPYPRTNSGWFLGARDGARKHCQDRLIEAHLHHTRPGQFRSV